MLFNFLRRASQVYTLRHHRARSMSVTDAELVEVGPPQEPPTLPPPLRRRRLRRHASHSPPPSPPTTSRPPSPPADGEARPPAERLGPTPLLPKGPPRRREHRPLPLHALPHLHLPHLHLPASPISPPFVSDARLTEIRASQRTFEGAYIRTALGLFSFALVVLKIFTSEFYSIGALFAAYGASVLIIALYRRHQGNRQYFELVGEDGLQRKRFRTSGNVVLTLTALSLCAYGALLALVVRLL